MQLQARRRDIGRLGYAFIVELPEDDDGWSYSKTDFPSSSSNSTPEQGFRRRSPDWIVGSG